MQTNEEEANSRVDALLKKYANSKNSIPLVDFRDCSLQKLPQNLLNNEAFCTRITKLNLRGNSSLNISTELSPDLFKNLTELNISCMGLSEIPKSLANFEKLSKLIVNENEITEIPEWMFSDECKFRKTLTMISLESNRITKIPEQLDRLTNLNHFQVHDNLITELPDTIANLANLQNLTLSKNKLESIALREGGDNEEASDKVLFSKLAKIKYFGFNLNKLSVIPVDIRNWRDLEFLNLSKCSLDYIPMVEVVKLKNLRHLILNGNNIGDDSWLDNDNKLVQMNLLTQLTQLDLRENNRMSELPEYLNKQVVKQTLPKLKKFRHSFAEAVIPDKLFISDRHGILKKEHMRKLNVTHILSVIDTKFLPELPHEKVERLHIDVLDEEHVDIATHFEKAVEFIQKALEQPDSRVVVHCVVGKSRSASCVLAYLMKCLRMTYNDAFQYLNDRRSGNIAPNPAFVEQLKMFEQQILKDAPITSVAELLAPPTVTSSPKAEAAVEELKMVLVVRSDLQMGKGKIAAQCAHAAIGAYRQIVKLGAAEHQHKEWLDEWENNLEPKIAVKVDSEQQLLEVEKRANELQINNWTMVDGGRTQVAPNTRTVLALGPCPVSLMNQATGKLKLL